MYLGFGFYLGLVRLIDQEKITNEKIESAVVPKRKGHVIPHRPSEEAVGLVRRREGRAWAQGFIVVVVVKGVGAAG